MTSLQDQLKAAQIAKATEELRAIELKTYLKDGRLVSTWDAEHDMSIAFGEVRIALGYISRTLTTHTTACHGGVMIKEIGDVVRTTVNDWVNDWINDDSRKRIQHEG